MTINNMIAQHVFPDVGKIAHVTPIFKKKDRSDKVNYRPVSVIGSFSKIIEKYIQEKMSEHVDKCLSDSYFSI